MSEKEVPFEAATGGVDGVPSKCLGLYTSKIKL